MRSILPSPTLRHRDTDIGTLHARLWNHVPLAEEALPMKYGAKLRLVATRQASVRRIAPKPGTAAELTLSLR
jgi:hypothetical protein